jgi:hypothetical protein
MCFLVVCGLEVANVQNLSDVFGSCRYNLHLVFPSDEDTGLEHFGSLDLA